ncbi:hypothetical protein M758_4G141000 [Ceratodon purpureus]|uniref:poly(ADP-ribose) glycohydrolase n=1 Tax=Ceratodon purpureus TaxID=3225 RepID=A0A8T0IAP0_CERPU|nr:hypothetical protein KC19_4G139500 [Ceratodon purpureus]KAG0619448.1 hypothetical protein M758_4G141000 [Ceratodon purpureus]
MGGREKLLPLKWEPAEAAFKWSTGLRRALHRLSQGAAVRTGLALADFISQVADQDTDFQSADGVAFYFDGCLEPQEKALFFDKTLPRMADLALRLPELLAEQSEQTRSMAGELKDSDDERVLLPLSLRILCSQQPGLILMSQELAASLLSCAFLCLFPVARRDEHQLPAINMDTMFEALRLRPSQAQKVHCLVNYFNRVCEFMPEGTISYERKVLSRGDKVMQPGFWGRNHGGLCSFEVVEDGKIEDVGWEYAQVDFANKFLGGGVLRLGCLQEEIRFMLSPELIVGMLFLPAMAENEVIEIIGSERFSNYSGYGGSFRYAGNFVDSTSKDSWGRRCTKIIAMDAVEWPGESQFQEKLLLREVCKAYCGFLSTEKVPSICEGAEKRREYEGIATGNWGCGAFGGDLSIKSMLQWIAASEAGWSTVKYYTFRDKKAERLHEAVRHIVENKYDMGQLWSALVSYGKLRGSLDKSCDFFSWLVKTSL